MVARAWRGESASRRGAPVAEAPLMAALGESGSPEDASLQLALRLQQACLPSLIHPAARPRPRPAAGVFAFQVCVTSRGVS